MHNAFVAFMLLSLCFLYRMSLARSKWSMGHILPMSDLLWPVMWFEMVAGSQRHHVYGVYEGVYALVKRERKRGE